MTTIIILLLLLLIGSIVVSGIVYSRQQALAEKQSQIKINSQKYLELQGLLQFILSVDNSITIAQQISHELLNITQKLIKLDKANEEHQLLYDNEMNRALAMKNGQLKAQGQQIVTSDRVLSASLRTLNEIGQLLQRFKVRGNITAPAYEEYLQHLQELSLNIELDSHLHFAEQLAKDNENRKAITHFKQAREALKRTRFELPNKNERIREITQKVEELQKKHSDQPQQNDESQGQQSSLPN